jgi:type VI secretion system ImpC/EvpB family protein
MKESRQLKAREPVVGSSGLLIDSPEGENYSVKPLKDSVSLLKTFRDFLGDEWGPTEELWLQLTRRLTDERSLQFSDWKSEVSLLLTQLVAELDELISEQVNEVLHHPRFQRLEAAWRGLQLVVGTVAEERARGAANILVRVLSVTWREIQRDFERAIEFDSSQLFKKIYEEEFGTAGGLPFGVMIGDYEVQPRPTADHPFDDMAILGNMAGVAAAAFCPFVCGASPAMFGVNGFSELEHTKDLSRGFQLAEFVKWRSLRRMEDARFIGLALPRIIMRAPYAIADSEGFCFAENTAGKRADHFLWGSAAFAWATVLVRAFSESGWLADIRGTDRNREGGGLVTGLPSIPFDSELPEINRRISADLIVTDLQEAELSRLGFLSLCQCFDSPFSAFYSSQSIQEPTIYDDPLATNNAKLSGMLQYILCVSRFSHYLKVLARDATGSVNEPEDLQRTLDRWVKQYVTPDENARPESKAKRPLRSAEIEVTRHPERPGTFQLIFRLLPHYQLDDLSVSIRLQTTESKGET